MRRYFLLALLVVATGLPTLWAKEPATKAKSPTGEKIVLFNGRDLDGWQIWLTETQDQDPKRVFRVTDDGLLHVTGDELGYIRTLDDYENYHLAFDFKWGERTWGRRADRTRDTGVLVHAIGPDGNAGTWMHSIEANIIEGGTGDFILVGGKDAEGNPIDISLTCEIRREPSGQIVWKQGGERVTFNRENRKRINWFARDPGWKDELGFRGAHDVERPVGEWNRMELVCDGGHIQVYLNGVMVNEGFDATPRSGKIYFQTELAEVYFRNIELYPLGAAPKFTLNGK